MYSLTGFLHCALWVIWGSVGIWVFSCSMGKLMPDGCFRAVCVLALLIAHSPVVFSSVHFWFLWEHLAVRGEDLQLLVHSRGFYPRNTLECCVQHQSKEYIFLFCLLCTLRPSPTPLPCTDTVHTCVPPTPQVPFP